MQTLAPITQPPTLSIRSRKERSKDFENVRFIVSYKYPASCGPDYVKKCFQSGMIRIEDLHWFINVVLSNLNCKVIAVFRVKIKS